MPPEPEVSIEQGVRGRPNAPRRPLFGRVMCLLFKHWHVDTMTHGYRCRRCGGEWMFLEEGE